MFYHADSGLYLTRYRAYDPRAARWLSRDPTGERGGTNLYAYVRGNPVNFKDLLGRYPIVSSPAAGNSDPALAPPDSAPTSPCPPPDDQAGDPSWVQPGDPSWGSQPGDPGWIEPGDPNSGSEPGDLNSGTQQAQALPPVLLFDEPPVIIRPPLPEFPQDLAKPPAPGWEWRGAPGSEPGGPNGNWYNPNTGESLHPDPTHPPPIGPHLDYKAPNGQWYRWFPNGNVQLKG